ncbi:hypothetical protein CKN82_09850 [Carnobacterium divergens]|uniref:YpmS family protein n=1 Tax=Carnobacterium divergens TaxID=2748 RepID=UPI001071788F|nr:YpmS family protein [Carnobacterium divergens]MDT1997375.1 YpmS family protein [Carnobacterium divergens]TFI64253.1 hypothetical protein CKN59_09730 [Carnobacterium divergens]TFI64496.1 hypothetical protein CKN76_09740 [Carnobacterium divergens]TFI67387.1 hypothetical protein CKN70_10005 [Carnobacterium divergens]TFI79660.1 hypothetical protein CKN74_09705 [Carnobacterium divergens]
MVEETKQRKQFKRPINPWKWAFLILIAILLGIGIWGGTKIFVPVNTVTEQKKVQKTEDVSFEVSTHKKEVNEIVAHGIDRFIEKGDIQYQLVFNEQAEVIGTFKLFNHDVHFYLYLDPFVMENGNVQLKATNLSIGKLNLPIGYVMNLISKQYNLPKWVQIDSKKQLIVLNLDEYKLENGLKIKAKKFDLKNDDIRFSVYLPLEELVKK